MSIFENKTNRGPLSTRHVNEGSEPAREIAKADRSDDGVRPRKGGNGDMSGSMATKASLQTRIRKLIAGTQMHAPNATFAFASTTFAAPALVQLFQSLVDALDAADAARARWQDALKNANDTRAKVDPFVKDYQAFVAITYAGTPSTLADYGVTPRKAPTPLTAQQKAAAAAKRKATRAARHTMGKVQKKGVKGTVIATVTPSAPTAAPASVAQSGAVIVPIAGTGGAATPHAQ
jgi:hypothetical protein